MRECCGIKDKKENFKNAWEPLLILYTGANTIVQRQLIVLHGLQEEDEYKITALLTACEGKIDEICFFLYSNSISRKFHSK